MLHRAGGCQDLLRNGRVTVGRRSGAPSRTPVRRSGRGPVRGSTFGRQSTIGVPDARPEEHRDRARNHRPHRVAARAGARRAPRLGGAGGRGPLRARPAAGPPLPLRARRHQAGPRRRAGAALVRPAGLRRRVLRLRLARPRGPGDDRPPAALGAGHQRRHRRLRRPDGARPLLDHLHHRRRDARRAARRVRAHRRPRPGQGRAAPARAAGRPPLGALRHLLRTRSPRGGRGARLDRPRDLPPARRRRPRRRRRRAARAARTTSRRPSASSAPTRSTRCCRPPRSSCSRRR